MEAFRAPGPGDDIQFFYTRFGKVDVPKGANVDSITAGGYHLPGVGFLGLNWGISNASPTILAGNQIKVDGPLTIHAGTTTIQSEQSAGAGAPTLLATKTTIGDLPTAPPAGLNVGSFVAKPQFATTEVDAPDVEMGTKQQTIATMNISGSGAVKFSQMLIAGAKGSKATVTVGAAIADSAPIAAAPLLHAPGTTNDVAVGWQGTGLMYVQSGTIPSGYDGTAPSPRNPSVGVLTVGGGDNFPPGADNPLCGTALTGGDGKMVATNNDVFTATEGVWVGGPEAKGVVEVQGTLQSNGSLEVGWGNKSIAAVEIGFPALQGSSVLSDRFGANVAQERRQRRRFGSTGQSG